MTTEHADLIRVANAAARKWAWRYGIPGYVEDIAGDVIIAVLERQFAAPRKMYAYVWRKARGIAETIARSECADLPPNLPARELSPEDEVIRREDEEERVRRLNGAHLLAGERASRVEAGMMTPADRQAAKRVRAQTASGQMVLEVTQ